MPYHVSSFRDDHQREEETVTEKQTETLATLVWLHLNKVTKTLQFSIGAHRIESSAVFFKGQEKIIQFTAKLPLGSV